MPEDAEHLVKRLHMRSIRRGIKEMDLILQAFAETRLSGMSARDLALYDALLNESDHDLYQWVTGQVATPESYDAMIRDIQSVMADGAVAKGAFTKGS